MILILHQFWQKKWLGLPLNLRLGCCLQETKVYGVDAVQTFLHDITEVGHICVIAL